MRNSLVAATIAIFTAFGAAAQSPERLPFDLGADEASFMPIAGPGQLRRISQLVWDAEAGELVQRQYEIRDLFGDEKLDITWEPRDASLDAARPSGAGVLTWRVAGTAPYDSGAVMAIYRGSLSEGMLHGEGTFWHRAGLTYIGAFEDGLFSGEGRLQHPGGDYYEGAFLHGRYHGEGRLIAANGEVFEGQFVEGRREGTGRAAPADGRAYTSLWREGSEITGHRRDVSGDDGLAHLETVQAISFPDAVLGVSVNQSLPSGVSPNYVTLYRGVNDGRRLQVEPGDREMMAQWLGGGALPVQDYWGASPFYFERFQPVTLAIALDYSGTRPVRITGGWIQVIESRTIDQPAIELRRGHYCGKVRGDLSVTNHVVSPLFIAGLEFWAGGNGNWYSAETLPNNIERADVSALGAVAAAGVDLNWLSDNLLSCGSQNAADCIGGIRASGRFGGLADRIYAAGSHVLVDLEGRMRYSFADGSGGSISVERYFTMPVKVGEVYEDRSECGAEQSEPIVLRRNPFMFEPRGSNYRLVYSLDGVISPGTNTSWNFQFDAPVSSAHVFQVYLQLSDGRTVATREIDLTYFKHRFQPDG